MALAAALVAGSALAAPVDIDTFLKPDQATQVRISPNGDYLAMTVPQGDTTGLVVIRRKDFSVATAVSLGEHSHASADFAWPVETLYFPREGHGFYDQANRKEYYTKLLAFLAKNLDGAAPK